MAEITPMMKQYFEIKKQYADTVLLFRLGDFYEMFFDDAKLASRELELVLTGRDWGQEERAPMCGVPFHSADSYIARLVAKGYKVAVCEQTEDPALAKGIVTRDVVRVLTPGTVIESSMLDEGRNNFLSCIFRDGETAGVCFADVSTGELHLTSINGPDIGAKITDELEHFKPAEILCNSAAAALDTVRIYLSNKQETYSEILDESSFRVSECSKTVLEHFKKSSLETLGLDGLPEAVVSLGAAINYLRNVQKSEVGNISEIDYYSNSRFMRLDAATRRNLELTETIRSREKKGSLLWVIDKTKTPMGKRLLRSWVEQPLVNAAKIIQRLNAVEELYSRPVERQEESIFLSNIVDMERLISRIVYATANAKELRALFTAIRWLPQVRSTLENFQTALLTEIREGIDLLEDVGDLIDASIVDDPPFTVREGGMIKDAYNEELDSLREITANGKDFIAAIQTREQELTGIKKLKIGYNRVFGYYIEISNSFKDQVPAHYIRKQTLANCERFITQELKELEAKVLGAHERIVRLEYELFDEIRKRVAEQLFRIQKTARAVASVDALCSLAQAAALNNYTCPEITAGSGIEIKNGRHPVVELMLEGVPFVPNDTWLDCEDNRCAIITGPNMAGKSTYMRQVALVVLMAQIGSFVPAESAKIGIVDSIFTRIGASDDLSAGQSTFMVEMSEVAAILKNASRKSLLIFDEIGRGTSTYDGMSIARSVLEFASNPKKLGAKTLFATHYHELTDLENQTDGVKNYNIAVKKRGDDITFLRRIVSGVADGSYGIEVAKLAGVPNSVVVRAKEILKELEDSGGPAAASRGSISAEDDEIQFTFTGNASAAIVEKLKSIDANTLTPIEALNCLYELIKEAGGL